MTVRAALVVLCATVLAAGPAVADPAPDRFGLGDDVKAAVRLMMEGRPDEGRRQLEALALAGRTDAAEVLGEFLGEGGPLPKDRRAACRWFETSARDRGDGRHNLAFCFETGDGGRQDLAEAARLYGEAGEMGFAKSSCALGNLMIAGKGVPKDVPGGVAQCLKGAEGGDPDAQTDVGNLYLQGEVVPKDMVKAAFWYQKAAAQRQANAAFVLGQMYSRGDGVPRDAARAVELWTLAYEGGRIDAAYLIGMEAAGRAFDKGPPARVDPEALASGIRYLEAAARDDNDPGRRKRAREVLDALLGLKAAVDKRNGA